MPSNTSKKCKNCGTRFEGRASQAVHCSDSCRQAFGKRAWNARSEEERRALARRYQRRTARKMGPLRHLLYRIKHSAKRRGIAFALTETDLKIPVRCPVLGIPLKWNLGIGRRGYHPNSISVDRIKPKAGYTPGNVRVISARANLLKNDASITELKRVLADAERLRNRACS